MSARPQEPYPIAEPEVTVGELVGRLTDDLGQMVRDHIQLARHEMVEEAKKAGRAAGLLTTAGLAGWLTLVMLTFSGAWALASALEEVWAGFLIMATVWLVIGVITALLGRSQLREVDPAPDETIAELREDRQWLREQTS